MRVGVLDESGRVRETEAWPEWLRDRAHMAGEMRAFVFARDPEDRNLMLQHSADLLVHQLDELPGAVATLLGDE